MAREGGLYFKRIRECYFCVWPERVVFTSLGSGSVIFLFLSEWPERVVITSLGSGSVIFLSEWPERVVFTSL